MAGFIKDHRKELESDVWLMPPLYHRTWQWLKYNVNHSDNEIPMRDGSRMLIKRGQRLTSVRDIARGISWYEGKKYKEPNPKSISSILEWMEKTEMISIQRGKGNREYTLITLVNYELYNELESKGNSKVTAKKQRADINNNDNNDKKKEGDIDINNTYTPEFEKFWNSYPKPVEKKSAYGPWKKLMRDKIDPELIIRCAMHYRTYCEINNTETQYIKNPTTFLNKDRYRDFVNPVLVQGGFGQQDVIKHYESKIGEVGQETRNIINRWKDNYGEDWVRQAIDTAHVNGEKSAAEVSTILKLWKRTGLEEPWHRAL